MFRGTDVIFWGGQHGSGGAESFSKFTAWPQPLPSGPAHATHSVNLSILHKLSEGHSDSIYHNEQRPGGFGPALPRGVHMNVALQPFSIGDVETTKCPSPGNWLKMIKVHP